MARDIQDYNGQVHAPDSDYPSGDIKDETGSNDGTRADRTSNADIHQFFMKLMRGAGITSNGLPDNEYNGLQFVEALLCYPFRRFEGLISQSSTGVPTVVEMPLNTVDGVITWTRNGPGDYVGTCANNFPGQMVAFLSPVLGFAKIEQLASDQVWIRTYDITGSLSDDILSNTSLSLHCYNP